MRFPLLIKHLILCICCCLWLPQVGFCSGESDSLQQAIELFEAEQYEEAMKLLKPLAGEKAEAAFYLGRSHLILDDLKAATKWLEKATELDGDRANYYFWLGNAYGQRAQNTSIFKAPGYARKVRRNFEKTVALDPENLQARFALLQFFLQAPGIMGGSDEEALLQAEEIKKLNAAWGHQAYAEIYRHDKAYELAEKEYLAAVEEQPDNLEMHYGLGYFYQQRENYEKAFQTFEHLLEQHPDEINALYQIGRTGALSGQNLDRAADCLRRYLLIEPGEDNPSQDWAHYRLGMVFDHADQADSARAHYEAALQLNPDHKEAKKALKKLK